MQKLWQKCIFYSYIATFFLDFKGICSEKAKLEKICPYFIVRQNKVSLFRIKYSRKNIFFPTEPCGTQGPRGRTPPWE
jgi:hypothetical protein